MTDGSSAGAAGRWRVSDAERAAVADRLLAAHGEGRLTLVEFDERVRRAHAATVGSDLTGLTADLPGPETPAARTPRAPRAPRAVGLHGGPGPLPLAGPCAGGGDLRAAAAVWAVVSTVNLVVWVIVAAGAGTGVYPWWLWVAGPWGLLLALRALHERAGGADLR